MAGEIQVAHSASGKTLYALVRNATGAVWQTTTSTFVTYATANLANYAVTMTEQGTASRFYAGTFPATSQGCYSVAVYERAGGSAAEGDTLAAAGNIEWDGSAVVPLSSRLAPTVAGRTLDISSGGEAGLDWANIGGATTTVNLSNTTTKNVNDLDSRIPSALVGALMPVYVSSMAVNCITDQQLDSTALSAIQGSLSNSLQNYKLDKLLAVAVSTGDVADNSALAKLASKSATASWASFDNTTDSLEAVRDRGDSAWGSSLTAASIWSYAGRTLTAFSFDVTLASSAVDTILDHAGAIEGAYTPRQSLCLILAALAGKLSGADTTTVTIRNTADTKSRIVATVDASGNRSAVTLDAS